MIDWIVALPSRIREAATWLSVQVSAAWAGVWLVYSQLPADVMTELAQIKWLSLSIVAWMGVTQTVTTVLARMKLPKAN